MPDKLNRNTLANPHEPQTLEITKMEEKIVFFNLLQEAFDDQGAKLKKSELNNLKMRFTSNGRDVLEVSYPRRGIELKIEIRRNNCASEAKISDLEA